MATQLKEDHGDFEAGAVTLRCPVPDCRHVFGRPPAQPVIVCPQCRYERKHPVTGCRDHCGWYSEVGGEGALGWTWLEFGRAWRCPACVRELAVANGG